MFDNRWPEWAEELASALNPILTKECSSDALRDAQRNAAEGFGRLPQLETALSDFGLYDLPPDPYLLSRAAIELGKRLCPVAFVSLAPASALLQLDDVANAVDRTVVPGACTRAVAEVDGALQLIDLSEAPIRRSSGGESIREVRPQSCRVVEPVDGVHVDQFRSWGFFLEAAQLVGAAASLIDYGVAYVSERKQFGVPVGSFQGVAFPLADAATAVSSAELLVHHAASLAADDGSPSLVHTAMAAHKAREASLLAASTVHQALGGYGFTIEADCQLFSRRIRAWSGAMPDTGPILADMARTLVNPATRTTIKDLWNFDEGFRLPSWVDDTEPSHSR